MKKQELDEYIPTRMLYAEGRTLDAIYLHFLGEYSVPVAAQKAGITRQAAGRAVKIVAEALLADGYERSEEQHVTYTKPRKTK